MAKSVTKNYIYNLFYQVLTLVTPLITTPYVSRVLGAEKIGIYGYTQSIVTYFILVGTVGVAMYGEREIAYIQGEGGDKLKEKRSKVFWEIILLRLTTVLIALAVFSYFFVGGNKYRLLYMIQMIDIVANIFDISWFFQGMEEFKKTVFRNMLVKLISVGMIFIFVRSASDLPLYALCYSMSLIVGNLSLWLYLPGYLVKIKVKNLKIWSHLKQTFVLFIPQVATQVYTVFDKTMLGKLATQMEEVGYYEQSQKIIKLLVTIITSLGVVMLPRIASIYAKKDMQKIKEYLDKSFRYTYFIGVPMMLGLIAINERFVPIFYGPGYEPIKGILVCISPVIVFIGLSNVIGTQYQIPTNKQRDYTLSVLAGAVVNFTLNLLLIPYFNAMGAVVATVIAEFIVLVVHYYCVRKEIGVWDSIRISKNYVFAGLIMFGVAFLASFIPLKSDLIVMCIQMMLGGMTYFAILFIIKDELLMVLVNKVIKRRK